MCIDFTSLNKAWSKDYYPLLSIDKLVDTTTGHIMVSILHAISRYHQIFMDPEDAEKTTFITDEDVFCYKVITFGLKKARAIYQRLVIGNFEEVIETIVYVSINDMVVKSKSLEDHLQDISKSSTS